MKLSIEGLRLFPPNVPRVFITSQPDKTRRRPATELACLLLWDLQQRAATTPNANQRAWNALPQNQEPRVESGDGSTYGRA